MDLSKYSVDPDNQTAKMVLVHPETFAPIEGEEGNQTTITLHGPDSTAQKEVTRKFQNKALKDGVKRKKLNISAEQMDAQALALTVAATADWENIELEGETLECTPENAKKLYKDYPWIREQVEEFMADRANFLGK